MVFSQLCSHYHQSKLLDGPSTSVSSNTINVSSSGISSCETEKKVPSSGSDNILGQVWVGVDNDPICIPTNSVRVVQGKTNKNTRCLMCLVEGRDVQNLPLEVVVN